MSQQILTSQSLEAIVNNVTPQTIQLVILKVSDYISMERLQEIARAKNCWNPLYNYKELINTNHLFDTPLPDLYNYQKQAQEHCKKYDDSTVRTWRVFISAVIKEVERLKLTCG